jgi:hypothetical protein
MVSSSVGKQECTLPHSSVTSLTLVRSDLGTAADNCGVRKMCLHIDHGSESAAAGRHGRHEVRSRFEPYT